MLHFVFNVSLYCWVRIIPTSPFSNLFFFFPRITPFCLAAILILRKTLTACQHTFHPILPPLRVIYHFAFINHFCYTFCSVIVNMHLKYKPFDFGENVATPNTLFGLLSMRIKKKRKKKVQNHFRDLRNSGLISNRSRPVMVGRRGNILVRCPFRLTADFFFLNAAQCKSSFPF